MAKQIVEVVNKIMLNLLCDWLFLFNLYIAKGRMYQRGSKLIYLLVQFSSPFCKYLALKLSWSAIKFWSTLVHLQTALRLQAVLSSSDLQLC